MSDRALLVHLAVMLTIVSLAFSALARLAAEPALLIDNVQAGTIHQADWQQCVRIDPGPLKPRTRPVLNPRQSEIV